MFKTHKELALPNLLCRLNSLDDTDGWADLVDTMQSYPDHDVVINAVARTKTSTDSYGHIMKEALWEMPIEKKWPRLSVFMENSESDVLAYMDFPQNHWSKIYSTNPLERLNKEVKRRSAVVGIFPCNASMVCLIGAVLMEQNDEWLPQDRDMPKESLERLLSAAKELAAA